MYIETFLLTTFFGEFFRCGNIVSTQLDISSQSFNVLRHYKIVLSVRSPNRLRPRLIRRLALVRHFCWITAVFGVQIIVFLAALRVLAYLWDSSVISSWLGTL